MKSADYCMLVNEWAWLTSQVCLLRLDVELASVLESKIGQKWRYGALKKSQVKIIKVLISSDTTISSANF